MASPPGSPPLPGTPHPPPPPPQAGEGEMLTSLPFVPPLHRNGEGGRGWGLHSLRGCWRCCWSLVALPPRLLETDRFVTTDELFWIGRSAAFGRAIETGQLGQTFQTGHPGVTTMWTAWLGMGSANARELAPTRREVSRREVSQSPAFLPALASARRAFGVVTALGVGLLGLLAWRLFGAVAGAARRAAAGARPVLPGPLQAGPHRRLADALDVAGGDGGARTAGRAGAGGASRCAASRPGWRCSRSRRR